MINPNPNSGSPNIIAGLSSIVLSWIKRYTSDALTATPIKEIFTLLWKLTILTNTSFSLPDTCSFCLMPKGSACHEHGHRLGPMNAFLSGISARGYWGASDPLVFTCRTLEKTMWSTTPPCVTRRSSGARRTGTLWLGAGVFVWESSHVQNNRGCTDCYGTRSGLLSIPLHCLYEANFFVFSFDAWIEDKISCTMASY